MPFEIEETSMKLTERALGIVTTGSKEDADKFLLDLKKVSKDREKYIEKAIKLGIFSRREYIREFKNKYLDKGYNSFGVVCVALVNHATRKSKADKHVVVTEVRSLLNDKAKLEKRFPQILIMSSNEAYELTNNIIEQDRREAETILGSVFTQDITHN